MKDSIKFLVAVVATLVLVAVAATATTTVKNYFSQCSGATCDNVLTIKGTQNIESGGIVKFKTGALLKNADGDTFDLTQSSVSNAAAGVASGYKIARGETALDNTNPTPATTGLTTIVACTATIKSTAAPGVGTSVVTYDTSSGTLNLYGWKVTDTDDATLIASTGTETIGWACIGTI